MKPIEFPQQNLVFAKDQKPYIPLPAHRGDNGQVISCWGLSLRERISLLFTGRLWVSMLTFGAPLQPSKLMLENPFIDDKPTGFKGFLHRRGLILGAVKAEADSLEAVPEHLRDYYEQDPATKKFKLNLDKLDVEDTRGLKSALEKTRTEAKTTKEAQERAIAEALKPYEGLGDPTEIKKLLSQFASEEEKKLIQAGRIDEVLETRMEKMREELMKQADTAHEERDGALELAATLMEDAVDNRVRAAASKAGMHPGAIEDALLRARQVFSLDDEMRVVQFGDDGETPVLNKEGKAPFSVDDWLEERRQDCPHWFPANAQGGNAPGGKGKIGAGADMSHLTPQERLTRAREAQAGQQRRP